MAIVYGKEKIIQRLGKNWKKKLRVSTQNVQEDEWDGRRTRRVKRVQLDEGSEERKTDEGERHERVMYKGEESAGREWRERGQELSFLGFLTGKGRRCVVGEDEEKRN
jgi:hypothetical protein